jgi:hypothetical protein
MHPTLDEMLALREGSASPEVAAHVNDCRRCSEELDSLDGLRQALRGLAQLEPPPGGWEKIRAEAQRRHQVRRCRPWAAAAAALVAAVVLWFGVGLVDVFRPEAHSEIADSADLDALITASGQLERALRVPSLRTRVLTPREAAQIVVLEDRIALIDLRLARSADEFPSGRAAELWSDRIELLDALVQARGEAISPGTTRNANFDEERSWQ